MRSILLGGVLGGVLGALLLSATVPLRAEPTIERYFLKMQGYRFLMREEQTTPQRTAGRTTLREAVLEEAGLESFSSWTIDSPGGARFQLQVFDLIDSLGAFQLFALWRDTLSESELSNLRSLELDSGNLYTPGRSVFWRGKFFFVASPLSGSLSETEFSSLVTRLTQAVPLENLLPVSASHLPEQGRQPGSIRFYLGASSLSRDKQFPAPLLEEIGFSDRIEIASALYDPGNYPLYLIGYPTSKLANEYFVKLQNRLQDFFSANGVYMKRAGVLVCIFVGPEEKALEVLSQVQYAASIQWLYEKDAGKPPSAMMTFFGLVTKAILGTGFLILMVLAAGLVVGLMRYEVLQRFPFLNRRKEMIRLNLDGKL